MIAGAGGVYELFEPEQCLAYRVVGGSQLLPPGPGRWWDPHLGPDTPLAPMPSWMDVAERQRPRTERPAIRQLLSRYGEAALDGAVKTIVSAPHGQQRG